MKKKVAVFEDEVHLQRLIKLIVENAGFETILHGDGAKGFEQILREGPPDLILLDIMMPGMDGLQVLKELKNNKATAHVPVVLLTALAQEKVVLQGIKLGAKDYIRKPFHPVEMLERLKKHLAS